VITGAASGIGRGVAVALAREGMNVALLDIDRDALQSLAAEVAALGVRAAIINVDVSQRNEVVASAAAIAAEFGDVHVLVGNAGVAVRGPLYAMDPATFDWLMSVNVTGAFNVIHAFVPAMLEHGQPGHIVLTASNASLYPLPGRENGAYASSKLADFGMAQSLRAGLRDTTLGVTALCPAVIATNIQRSGRHRPERFGGPFERADAGDQRAGMTAEQVGRIVVRAILNDDPLAITHPGGRPLLDAHYDDLRSAHDRWTEILPDMQIDPTLSAL
jgi:NAD(P)-dependent dehydrogenase (short-subunit alcohol dehydrogenase family)